MIQERYCSYEVARLLKEKGFDEACKCVYTKDVECFAPTHQMACDWLREKGIQIFISCGFPYIEGKEVIKYFWSIAKIKDTHLEYPQDEEEIADTFGEAVEAALRYCLTNLI